MKGFFEDKIGIDSGEKRDTPRASRTMRLVPVVMLGVALAATSVGCSKAPISNGLPQNAFTNTVNITQSANTSTSTSTTTSHQSAKQLAGIVQLERGMECSDYDIDGDGKADTVLVTSNIKPRELTDETVTISVNGRTAYTATGLSFGAQVFLLGVGGETHAYVVQSHNNGDMSTSELLAYRNGRFESEANLREIFDGRFGSHLAIKPKSVSGKRVSFDVSLMCWATGPTSFVVDYELTGGKLKLVGGEIEVSMIAGKSPAALGNLTTSRWLQAYSAPDCNTKAFRIEANTKAAIVGANYNGEHLTFHLRLADGRDGWIATPATFNDVSERRPYFTELSYAG